MRHAPTALPNTPRQTHPAKKHAPHFPRPANPCLQSPIPPRIHRKALRRGGVGAGREGATQNFTHRARGKWSPSGETGEMAGCRTGPPFCPDQVAGRACAAHNMAAAPCGVRGLRPCSHGAVEDDADRRSWLRHREILRACMTPSQEGRATVPTDPAIAERPQSRAKTAERGAARCHVLYIQMRQLQRPVRCSLKKPRAEIPPRGPYRCRHA